MQQPAPQRKPGPQQQPEPQQKREKQGLILMIDDDEFIAGLYAHTLTSEGFEVVLAPDGLAGLRLAKELRPDVILLDVVMPELTGFEVLARLKDSAITKDIPVIMLTSLSQDFDLQRGMQTGAFGYLVKTRTIPEETLAEVRKAMAVAK